MNTTEAVWAKDASDITDEQYADFYRFVASAFDEPSVHPPAPFYLNLGCTRTIFNPPK